MLHLYCGDGKGKTTAALGLILRHIGAGGTAALVQFLKSGETGELSALQALGVPIYRNDFPHGFAPQMDEATRERVIRSQNENLHLALELVRKGKVSLLVLDEAIAADNLALLNRESLRTLLDECNGIEVVLTGRNPAADLIERADYVTDMRLVKHPFTRGVCARRGVEY